MVFLIILIVLILLYVFLLIPRLPRRDMSALTKVDYAHRGLWNAQRPENSLSAFQSAVDSGTALSWTFTARKTACWWCITTTI